MYNEINGNSGSGAEVPRGLRVCTLQQGLL
jgi:hypothetical protein